LGILFARPGKGIMRQVTGPYTGSVMSRRLLPFALLVPAAFGWAALFSPWRNTISIQLSAAVLVTAIILISMAFISYNTVLLNRRDLAAKQAHHELQAIEQRFSMLINSVKDYAIVMIDHAGRVLSWNNGAQAITGYTAEEAIGRNVSLFYHHRDIEDGVPEYNRRQAKVNGQFHREGWRPRKDGSRYWAEVTWTAIWDDQRRLQAYIVIVRDTTERKRAQEKIAYQARLMEDSSDAVFSVDPDYRLVSFNKAAEALYGYTAAEVIGKPLNDVLRNPMDDATRAAIRRELLEVGYWRGDVVYHTRDKGVLDISISISRTSDERGRVDGYIMVCRDMTERLKAEARLRKFNEELERQVKEKTAALVRSNTELRDLSTRLQLIREEERAVMAREIHDELGQQLTGLKMDLYWVARKLDGAAPDQAREKLRSTISLLDNTIQTVRRIATDLRPSILDDLGLIAAIEWQSQEFQKRSGIRTTFTSSVAEMDFPPEMSIGMFRICQESLTNVARHASASNVSITLDQAGGEVRLVIADDGKGLDPERADNGKTLGLLGMKERALMMGGRLEFGNGEKNGLQLVLTVPLAGAPSHVLT
ncbi:MAG TPA: PAS domain S-box protein, partial [Puia sp.]|nr:PAS domain S-box protein [Puia sp.]